MGEFIQCLDYLRTSFPNLSNLVIHHPGKDEEKGPRGHSSLSGALECSMYLKGLELRCKKMKGGELFKPIPLALEKEGDSVVMVPKLAAITTVPLKAKALTENQAKVLAALAVPMVWSAIVASTGVAGNSVAALGALKVRGLARQRVEDGLWEATGTGNTNTNTTPTPTPSPHSAFGHQHQHQPATP
jgi:hypothetical protein